MIIKRITVRNFGKLRDRTMEFSDGINVLYGDNESGKTTTHTFVMKACFTEFRDREDALPVRMLTICIFHGKILRLWGNTVV